MHFQCGQTTSPAQSGCEYRVADDYQHADPAPPCGTTTSEWRPRGESDCVQVPCAPRRRTRRRTVARYHVRLATDVGTKRGTGDCRLLQSVAPFHHVRLLLP